MRKVALLAIAFILTALLAGCAGGEEAEADKTPPAIYEVSVSNITETSATITWTTNEPSHSQVYYGLTTNYGSTVSTLHTQLVTDHTIDLTGFEPDTTYHYCVASRDASGNEATSEDDTFTTLPLPDTTAPLFSDVTVTDISETTATITWTTDEPATSQVEYGTTESYGLTTPLSPDLTTEHSIVLTDLEGSTTYYFRVVSGDAAENKAVSVDYSFATLDLTVPVISGVSVSGVTTSSALIIWSTNEPSTSQVEYGTTLAYGLAFPLDTTLVTSHSVDLSGLESDTIYHFRVKSKDEAGNEAISVDYTFSMPDTIAPTISDVTVSGITENSATVTWTTNEPATSQVEYGKTIDYGLSTPLKEGLVTSHSVNLIGLEPNTTYHFIVKSKDATDNEGVSEDYTFMTMKPTQQVGGVISTNIVWTQDYDYIVSTNIVVGEGVTLSIEPGVTIRFEYGKAMQVNGELIARGTEDEYILFTSNQVSPTPGDWVNILFTDSSVDATFDGQDHYVSGSILQWCTVEYGGRNDASAVKMSDSSPFIDSCTIRDNASNGICINAPDDDLVITNNTISNNSLSTPYEYNEGGAGIFAYSHSVTISDNTITNNTCYFPACGGGIYIFFGSAVITDNTIANNLSGNLAGGVYAYSCTATISGNTIIGNGAGTSGGGVCARSTVTISNNSITGNSAGERGGGIYAEGTVTIIGNTITNNSSDDLGGGIHVYTNTAVIIDDNVFAGNSAPKGGGIYVNPYTGGEVTITHNEITGNNATSSTGGGIHISQQPIINHNDIYANTPYDVYNSNVQGTAGVDCANNWWGTTNEATIQAHIYDWYDDASLGIVNYSPYLTEPVPIEAPTLGSLTVQLINARQSDSTLIDFGNVEAPISGGECLACATGLVALGFGTVLRHRRKK